MRCVPFLYSPYCVDSADRTPKSPSASISTTGWGLADVHEEGTSDAGRRECPAQTTGPPTPGPHGRRGSFS